MLKTSSSVTNAVGALNYKGSWNASTNVPTLVSGVGNKGDYYVISVTGSTNLDGTTLWSVGDLAVFNGTIWQKIEGGDVGLFSSLTVTTLNGYMYGNGSNVVTASTTIPVASVTGAVPNTVNVLSSGLLSGGGALTGNVTLSLTSVPVANVSGAVANTVNVLAGGLLTGGGALTGNVTLSLTSVPFANVTGYGTMATQNSNAVTITGGTVDNVTIGGTTAAAGTFTTMTANSTAQFGRASANYAQITGGATANAVQFQTLGSDTNVGLAIQPKGTGAIDLAAGSSGVNISNGGTVTALTRSASGSNYTTNPTPSITAPTTAGGVQAVATCTISCGSATVSAGGSGYVVGEILTVVGGTNTLAAVLTVATVSGTAVATVNITTSGTYTASPTNPAATTSNLSGTGATFTLNFSVSSGFTITNAGSGYVEQPTVTFSGGGGSGAAAYATVGSATIIRSIGTPLSFYVPGGEAFRISDNGVSNPAFINTFGSSSSTVMYAASTGATVTMAYASKGAAPINFATNGTTANQQFSVSHTASAVNYVQVTGAATGNPIDISSQGSDASVSMQYSAKNAGNHIFRQAGGTNFRVNYSVTSAVNNLAVTGSLAGSAPILSAQGTDADIDLTLTPKGAGNVRFGTYTVSALLSVAGYITIKDSGGTSRRLLVG